jgi:hypothetical protein
VTRPAPYLLTGVYIWACVLQSGVHATLAGGVVALAIPSAGKSPGEPSLLERLEESLHPSIELAQALHGLDEVAQFRHVDVTAEWPRMPPLYKNPSKPDARNPGKARLFSIRDRPYKLF